MGKILVCGAKGQLGKSIQAVAKNEADYIYADKSELDITDKSSVANFIKRNSVKIIINCSAYTAVDNAEDDFEKANLLNNLAVRGLAEACAENNVFLIHISTDYVFDGQKSSPYVENDTPNPKTVYGKTKLDGEKAIQEICKHFLILRTAWLYSEYGTNFAKTILRLSKEKNTLKVVNDQIGTPTYAYDLAQFIVKFIEQKLYKTSTGIYHFSNEGQCSWYDFAKELVTLSGLDTTKLEANFHYEIPHWQESVKKFCKAYCPKL